MGNLIRRSILFVPADKIERIKKSILMSSDNITIDLEDAVSVSKREEARQIVKKALDEFDFGSKEIAVRINNIRTLDGLKDILMLKDCNNFPNLVIHPKTESAEEVRILSDLIEQINSEIKLLIILETSKGILNAKDIVIAKSKVVGLIFGGGDLSSEIGYSMSWSNMYTARQIVLMAAASAEIDAIDVPYLDVSDSIGLAKECKMDYEIGFTSKIAIHPNQIEIINKSFMPSLSEIEDSKKIIQLENELGSGATCINGKMIDKAIIKKAHRIIELSNRIDVN